MVLMQWLLSSLFLDSDIWMREFTVTFTWASELGTSIAIRLSAVVAQEEAAKNYSGVDPWILFREGLKFEGWMPKAGEGGRECNPYVVILQYVLKSQILSYEFWIYRVKLCNHGWNIALELSCFDKSNSSKKKVTDCRGAKSFSGETNCAKWNFAMVRFYWY